MEISNFQVADEAQPLKILHPVTKEETDIVLFCLSPDHPEYKSRMIDVARSAVKNKKPEQAIDAIVDKKQTVIARMVNGWKNIKVDGKELKYSEKNAVKLMTEYPWIADQVDKFCGDRANFFKGSSKV